MPLTICPPVTTDEERAASTRTLFVDSREAEGCWRCELVPSRITGLPRDTYVYRAPRKTDPVTFSWHGDAETFCPPLWWDLAIGSGPCGFGCRACFLMLTFRAMRDPFRPLIYDNLHEIWRAVGRWLHSPKRKATHALGLGIDRSDSLLYEGLTGHARELIPRFADPAANRNSCRLILLTKSTNVHFLEGLPTRNVVVTFSVNPGPVADLWEGKYPDTMERISPPIAERLRACLEAQEMDFETRLRLDPILTPPGWQEVYREHVAEIVGLGLRPSRVTLGTYREKSPQLDTWREKWGLPPMEWEPEGLRREGTHRHVPDERRIEIYTAVRDMIRTAMPDVPVSLCKETHAVRRATGLSGAECNCLA